MVLRVMRVPLLKYSEYQPNAHHLVEHCRDHGLFDLSIAMKPDRLHVLCARGARQAVSYLICSITNSDVDTEETRLTISLDLAAFGYNLRDCLGADVALPPQTTIHVARNPLELVVRQVARLTPAACVLPMMAYRLCNSYSISIMRTDPIMCSVLYSVRSRPFP